MEGERWDLSPLHSLPYPAQTPCILPPFPPSLPPSLSLSLSLFSLSFLSLLSLPHQVLEFKYGLGYPGLLAFLATALRSEVRERGWMRERERERMDVEVREE